MLGLLIFVSIIFSVYSFSAVLYVSPSAQPNKTCTDLQNYQCSQTDPCDIYTAFCKAADNKEDDTIILKPGTYNIDESVLYKPLGLKGSYSLKILAEDPTNKPVIDGANSFKDLIVINTQLAINEFMAEISIENVIFINTGNFYGLKFFVSNATIVIKNCEFINGGNSLYISMNGSDIDISRNIFDGVKGIEIYNYQSINKPYSDIFIRFNTFRNIKWWGMYFTVNDKEKIYITNNEFLNNGTATIPLIYVLSINLSNEYAKLFLANNLFADNVVTDSGVINIFGKGSSYIVNNTFVNNSAIDNTALSAGIHASGDGFIYIYNNLFWNNTTPNVANPQGEDIYISVTSSYHIELFNNLFSNDAAFDPAADGGSSNTQLESRKIYISDTSKYSYGGNVTTTDPLLNTSYRLNTNSPAIDAGTNNYPYIYLKDIDSEPRIMGNSSPPVIDIGADEYAFPTPDIDVISDEVFFGEVYINDVPIIYTLEVINGGVLNADLNISGVSIVNETKAGSFSIVEDNCTGNAIPEKGKCTLKISFIAKGIGLNYAELEIISNDPDEQKIVIKLKGWGIERFPDINVQRTVYNFGDVKVGDSKSLDIVVENKGKGQLNIYNVFVSDKVSFKIKRDECSALNLPEGGRCIITVEFVPESPGDKEAYLYINSDDPYESSVSVLLKGKGLPLTPPLIKLNKENIDFGTLKIGKVKSDTITIMNEGEEILTVFDVYMDGSGVFSINKNECINSKLKKNKACNIVVSFKPEEGKDYYTRLFIVSNASNRPKVEIYIKGEGVDEVKEETVRIVNISDCQMGGINPALIMLILLISSVVRRRLG